MAWGKAITRSSVGFVSVAIAIALVVIFGSQGAMEPQNAGVDQLKTRLYSTDQDTSALAFGELARMGKQATPLLIEALGHSTPRTRRLAAEGLAEIRDPASADALERATHDSNGEVRSRAAVALHLLGDPRALAALARTLDDYPDILHNPYTASMYQLMGDRAVLPLMAPLLKAPQPVTRERALLVIKAVVSKMPEGSHWDQLWESLGRYDPQGQPADRDRAAELWTAWIRKSVPPVK
ncbi:MAG TPA: HEAT repeat domain-containing protein [Vicinamibacterales bacterium]|nr:HEAT repeat domain-containing protein [Vicinamibacterales bacterium]